MTQRPTTDATARAATSAAPEPPSTLRSRVDATVRDLAPGCFALVMATGIVSVGLLLEGFEVASFGLLALCAAAFAGLLVLSLVRVLRHPRVMLADLLHPGRTFGFFTLVAGANVLAERLLYEGQRSVAIGLIVFAIVAWLVLGAAVPWAALLGRAVRPLVSAANGSWFIWVVASQSIAVATATLQPTVEAGGDALAVLALATWALGVVLYVVAGLAVALRVLLYELPPIELTPPYWVAMGACAITVLAGAHLLDARSAMMTDATTTLVTGTSLAFWALATALFPVLIALGWWRHRVHRVPLRYEPNLWSMVFPLGMYAVSSMSLGAVTEVSVIELIGRVELWLAVIVWALTATGVARFVWGHVLAATRRVAERS